MSICNCRDPLCGAYGCQRGCLSRPSYQGIPTPLYFEPVYQPPQQGCICPPGANKDCENPVCPRKRPPD